MREREKWRGYIREGDRVKWFKSYSEKENSRKVRKTYILLRGKRNRMKEIDTKRWNEIQIHNP